MNHVVIIPDYVLGTIVPVEVRNVFMGQGEKFFQVPIDECILRSLHDSEIVPGTKVAEGLEPQSSEPLRDTPEQSES